MTNEPGSENDVASEEIDEDWVVRFRDSVTSVELDGEAVLLAGDTGAVHTLNPTATLVYRCVDGEATLREIIDDFAAVFDDVGRAAIAADILQLVRTMGDQGLLVGVRAASMDFDPVDAAGEIDHSHGVGADEH